MRRFWTLCARALLLALAIIGFARVYHNAVTTAPFEHPDELYHYDTVVRYAHGLHIGAPQPLTDEVTPYYGPGPAFFGKLPPNARLGLGPLNHEVVDPPIYYALAALWYHMGRLVDVPLPEWTRLLAGLFVFCTVPLGYVIAKEAFPGSGDVRPFLVAAVVAFFPSSDLCSVTADSLCPLVFGAMLLAVISFHKAPTRFTAFAIGVMSSTMLLTKTTLLPLVAVGLCSAGFALGRWQMLLSFAAGLVPYAVWLLRNWLVLGELTAVNSKFSVFRFYRLPINEWTWNKLALSNLWLFWHELADSFVFGEYPTLKWDDNAGLLGLFVFTAALAIPASALVCGRGRFNRWLLLTCLGSFVGGIGFLAMSSIMFNFDSNYGFPTGWLRSTMFSNGRLMSGALIPFAILLVFPINVHVRSRRE
jgi:hypothetical protein